MSRIHADRIRESSATVGTDDMVLDGAFTGYRSFDDVMADGDTCYYCIQPFVGDDWELGVGTYDADENVLQRTTVIESSQNNTYVPFQPGTKNVAMVPLASRTMQKAGALTSTRIPYVDSNGELTDSAELTRNSDGAVIVSATTPVFSTSIRGAFIGSTSNTSTTSHVLVIGLNSTGTPAAGFGSRTEWWLESSTTNDTVAARVDVAWQTATHASRAADWILYTYYTGTPQEAIRVRSASGGVQIGYFGATPVAQQGNTTDLKNVLVNLGFLVDGGATPLNLDAGAFTAGTITGTVGTFTDASTITVTDAVVTDTSVALTLEHDSSGTPGTDFAVDLAFRLESSTQSRASGSLRSGWATATDASRASYMTTITYYTSTAQIGIRQQSSSGGVMLGFFSQVGTPVVQPSSTGETTGHTAGVSTAVRVDSTFTGNVGSTAYTPNDIVKHLKNLGIIAM